MPGTIVLSEKLITIVSVAGRNINMDVNFSRMKKI